MPLGPSVKLERCPIQRMNEVGSVPSGAAVTAREIGTGAVRQTEFTFNSATLSITDNGTTGSGSLQIYDFPAGVIGILGCTGKLTYAYSAATDASMLSSVGTGAINADGDLGDAGEGNVVPSTASAIATSAGTFTAKSTSTEFAASVNDGAATAKDLYLNMATASDPAGTQTVTITGKIVVTWINFGDATGIAPTSSVSVLNPPSVG
jgi:hypothetical protein